MLPTAIGGAGCMLWGPRPWQAVLGLLLDNVDQGPPRLSRLRAVRAGLGAAFRRRSTCLPAVIRPGVTFGRVSLIAIYPELPRSRAIQPKTSCRKS